LFCEKNNDLAVGLKTLFPRDIVSDVYDVLKDEFHSSEPVINEILEQIFSRQGKGIRTTFMAIIAEMVGGSWESLRKAAVVIEAIHLASLLHDDVVDGSEMRRGKASLNAMHSNKISVLFGDYIFTKALMIAQKIESCDAVSIIHSAVKRMIEGEILDSLHSTIIDEETYFRIIKYKTASLFAASGELGVVLSGVNGIERVWAKELGECLGIAFQIIDDTLDYKGDSEVMGKPILKDIVSGNMTLPLIHSLRKYTLSEIQDIVTDNEGSIERLSEIVRENGGVEYAYGKAHEYSVKAREIIHRFGNAKLDPVFDYFNYMLMNRSF
jgi:octaprenyl-diphosphate synthase